ncbi:MAG: aminopeptidase [Candidatus Bipolaricaulaceae bacterium]
MEPYAFELGRAADVLVRELLRLAVGEALAITADTESDPQVVQATAQAACAAGGKPMVIWTASPTGVGKAADPLLPLEALAGALKGADAWVEFNNQWLLYSTPYEIAMRENRRLRHLCLVGMTADMMVRCIGRIDFPALAAFQEAFVERLKAARHVRVTTPAGTDIEFDHVPDRPVKCRMGRAHQPGSEMLAGQISVAPKFKSIQGVIVFDGSLVPPVGLLADPIRLTVEQGEIEKIEGGKQARAFRAWLTGFDHPQMLRLAHISYGFNPGAKLSGDILEDERVWGGTEWGIGSVGRSIYPPDGIPAPSHCDGTCLDSSVWLDGDAVTRDGQVVDPELACLAAELGG